jgi:hypothetical protein
MIDLSNYMLYNFYDSPADLFSRMHLNVSLNEELGIRIYSFPMRYQPTDLPDRSHIGPKWNRYYLRSVQIVLQATHGVVSGEPAFYKAAFGSNHEEFEQILTRPHHMIFNRQWYERYGGRGEFDDYLAQFSRLSSSEKLELVAFLSGRDPGQYKRDLRILPASVRKVARYYVPLGHEREREIRRRQRTIVPNKSAADIRLTTEQIVEDAGLDDELICKTERPLRSGRVSEVV